MTKQQLSHRPFKLSIAEWEMYDYWRFDHEKPLRFVKEDTILGVCEELMDFLAYTQFSKLSIQTKADLVATIISNKKQDWTFTSFEIPYDYSDEDEDDS